MGASPAQAGGRRCEPRTRGRVPSDAREPRPTGAAGEGPEPGLTERCPRAAGAGPGSAGAPRAGEAGARLGLAGGTRRGSSCSCRALPLAPPAGRAEPGPRAMTAGGRAEGAEPDAARPASRGARVLSALFYGACSFLLVLLNKALLTTYG